MSTLSKPLDRLLNGKMQEAVEGRVVWDDLDEGTFVRFIHWAYTGSYDTPEPDMHDATIVGGETELLTNEATAAEMNQFHCIDSIAAPPASPPFEPNCLQCGRSLRQPNLNPCMDCGATFPNLCGRCHLYGNNSKCPGCSTKVVGEQQSKRISLAKRFTYDMIPVPSDDIASPRRNETPFEDYGQIFLAHARLYTLADKYDIPKLGELAYRRLWATLSGFTLYPSRGNHVIHLILYTFGAFSESARDNKMCKMLALYAACMFEDLVKCDAFEDLIDQSPIFSHQMMKLIAERLN